MSDRDLDKRDDERDDDFLRESFTALREETTASAAKAPEAAKTRRALLIAATSRRRRRTVVVRLVLPLAAVLAVSSAWAAATGRLPRVFQSVSDVFRSAPEHDDRGPHASSAASNETKAATEPSAPPTTSASASAIATSEPVPSSEPTAATPPTSTTSAIAVAPAQPSSNPVAKVATPATVSATTTAATPTSSSSSSSTNAAVDPEEAQYRTAHEAHFVTKDWNKALTSWDAYLAAYPKGRFAPEARYNRALTLVRLNRRDEAKQALRPFADGTFGGYRQKEAKQLLEALEP